MSSLSEGSREELLDLLLVDRLATSRDGARRLTSGVQRVLALVVLRLVRRGEDTGADVGPRAVVKRLLLAPEQVRVGVLVEVRGDLRYSEQARPIKPKESEDVRGRRGTARSARHGRSRRR